MGHAVRHSEAAAHGDPTAKTTCTPDDSNRSPPTYLTSGTFAHTHTRFAVSNSAVTRNTQCSPSCRRRSPHPKVDPATAPGTSPRPSPHTPSPVPGGASARPEHWLSAGCPPRQPQRETAPPRSSSSSARKPAANSQRRPRERYQQHPPIPQHVRPPPQERRGDQVRDPCHRERQPPSVASAGTGPSSLLHIQRHHRLHRLHAELRQQPAPRTAAAARASAPAAQNPAAAWPCWHPPWAA